MIRFLPAIILLFAGNFIKATEDSGVIKGIVYDAGTHMPLPSATVVYGKNKGTSTGDDGSYLIEVESGINNLVFRFVGYQEVEHTVFVAPADTVILNVELEYGVSEIDQIVVSAGRVEQRVAELTVSMNIIKPRSIEIAHISNAAELINRSPGIEVMDGQASIRGGSGFSYGAGSRVLALVDGLPVLSADAGNIKWQFLPLENISQIEVIKGASSVMYGSSALNGVVNIRTAEPGGEPVTKFYLETGLFDKPARREWIWWDSPRTFHSTSLSHVQRSGNTDIGLAVHLLFDRGYRKLNDESLGRVNLKLNHNNGKLDGLSYGFNINAGITRKTDFILWENAQTGALKQDESVANELHGNLLTIDPFISLKRNERFTHHLRTRLQSSQNDHPSEKQNNSRAVSFLAEYQLIYNLSDFLDLNFGLTENYGNITSPLYGDHYSVNLAGYVQADISIAERMKLVSGLRVEHNTLDGSNDKLVPLLRAGINYRLFDYTFLRASFGQGYRFPSIAEKYAATTLGSVRIVPNTEIRSESGWTSEVGVKQGIVSDNIQGQVDIALFYSRYNDMIEFLFGIYPVPGEESFDFGFMASNVEQSQVYGTELEISLSGSTGKLHHVVNGGYTYIYPVEAGAGSAEVIYLKYRRKHSFKLNLATNRNRFGAGISINAGSPILDIDNVFLDELTREAILPGFYEYWNESDKGHIVIDPHFEYSFNERYKLSVVVKNVLNTEYMGRPGDIMPHRNFSLRFSGSL